MSLALSACAAGSNLPLLDATKSNIGVKQAYRLSVGDKIKINVFGEADLSGTFEVDPRGNVPYPLIGSLAAQNLSVEEFRLHLVNRLSNGYLKRPKVTVDILNYRPIYVHGEVRKGGEHPFRSELKLRDAIVIAGGYTYRAEESYVILTRAGRTGTVRVAMPADITVMPGDNIRIPERFF